MHLSSVRGKRILVVAVTTLIAVSGVALNASAKRVHPGPGPWVSTDAEVIGYGHQQGPARHDLFGIFAQGSGNSATGTASVWAGSPQRWVTGKVTCVETTGNDSIVTIQVKIKGVLQYEVAEVVDNSNPSGTDAPDELRFSYDPFIDPTDTPGCYTPELAPIALKSGDVRIDGPAS